MLSSRRRANHQSPSFFPFASTPALRTSRRFVYVAKPGDTSDPTKQHHIPDRLRDAFAFYGADVTRAEPDDGQDIPYRSPDQRQQMMQGLLGMHSHTISLSTLDKVRIALDGVKRQPPEHDDWRFLNSLLRNSEMCLELVPEPTDVFPAGDKCWVHLSETAVRRKPYVLHFRECGNSFCVMPVFTQEEYLTHYFQRMKTHDATWFPMPRMGTQRTEYHKNKFPVCAHGPLAKLCALAIKMTAQGSDETFCICINPFQQSSKFITYNEMIKLSKMTPKEQKEQEQFEKRKQMNPFGKAMEGSAMMPRAMGIAGGTGGGGSGDSPSSSPQSLSMTPPSVSSQPESAESFFVKMEKQKEKLRKQQERMLGYMKKDDEKKIQAEAQEQQAAKKAKEEKSGVEQQATTTSSSMSTENNNNNNNTSGKSETNKDDVVAGEDFQIDPPTVPVESTDLGKMYTHELNERDRVTRETLRRARLQKVTPSDGSTSADLHFSKIFDTSKWVGKRITPTEAVEYARGDIAFPAIEDLCKKIDRVVPVLGKTVEEELRETEEELQRFEAEQKNNKKNRSVSEIDPNTENEESQLQEDEVLNKHAHKIKNLGFAMDSLREKFPQFNKLRKPPPARPKEPRPVTAEMLRHKLNQEAIEAVVGAPTTPDADRDAASELKPHWVFPVLVPVTRKQRQEQELLQLPQKSLMPIRVPRIAHDELLLLLFDIPHVKLVVGSIVRRSAPSSGGQLILQIGLVTTDPLVLLEEIVKRERTDEYEARLKAAGDKTLLATQNAGDQLKQVINDERAEKLTSEIEAAAADGRARLELSWSFPKNKQNSPYPVEFVNMSTSDWVKKIMEEDFANAYAILYDRTARNGKDLETAKVIGRPSLRQSLDYDGEDIDVISDWHKADRPFWGLS